MLKHTRKITGKVFMAVWLLIIFLTSSNATYARILFKGEFLIEDNGSDTFIIDAGDDVTGNISLQFGSSLAKSITFDTSNNWFEFNDDINLNQYQLKNAVIENSATTPLSPIPGQIYYNTVSNNTYVWNGTIWEDITATGGSGNDDLDSVYATDPDKIMNVNDPLGLEFNSSVSSDIMFDMQNTGDVVFQDAGTTFSTFTDTGEFKVDNLQLDANSITSTNINGNITVDPNGNGSVNLGADTNIDGNNVVLDADNTGGNVKLQFGQTAAEALTWNSANQQFDLSDDITLNQNQIRNVVVDNLATAPLSPVEGQVYYNTANKQMYMYTLTGWQPMGYHAATHVNGEDDIQLATNTQKGLMSAIQVQTLEAVATQSDEINRNTIDVNLVLGENVVSNVAYLTYYNPDDVSFVANIENVEYTVSNNTSPGIALTGGTDINPTLNYVYVRDTGAVEASTTNPLNQAFNFVPIAEVLVGSVGVSTAKYFYIENLTNFIRNFIRDVNNRLRLDQTIWLTGINPTTTGLDIAVTAGTVMHIHETINYPARNTALTDTMIDMFYNVYGQLDNTNYDNGSGGNTLIGNNKYHKIFIWGDIYGGLHMERQRKPPSSEYTSREQAIADPEHVAVGAVPVAWEPVGFPIAYIVMSQTSGVLDIIDLRAGGAGGGGGGGHAQNTDVGTDNATFTLNTANAASNTSLIFGAALNESLTWNLAASAFDLSDDLNVANNLTVGASAETISNPAFILNGNDAFIADSLGVEGQIYTDATATKYIPLDINGSIRTSAVSGTVAGGKSPVVRLDGTDDSRMAYSFPVPDDWTPATDIVLKIFWSPSDNTSGNVDFDLDFGSFATTEILAGGSFTDLIPGATYQTVSLNTQLNLYQFTVTLPAASLSANDMINFRLSRTPADAGDTYAGDINVHLVRIEYAGKKLL